jgi:ribonuclease III
MTTNAQQLEHLLEYTFRDQTLLVQALTHPSYLHEASGNDGGDYQRLEFLGDAVLGLLLAELLYVRYPDWDEGALSQLRSRLAGQDVLADRARWLGIGNFVLLGRGEKQTAGREKDSILADVLEALLAALYRDGGLQAARTLVERLFEESAAAPETLELGRDSKSELQEYLSSSGYPLPEYRLIEESGPPHDHLFIFQILVGDKIVGVGQGKSKKIAQQAAAAKALGKFQSAAGQRM